jgi:hypothetical protein
VQIGLDLPGAVAEVGISVFEENEEKYISID